VRSWGANLTIRHTEEGRREAAYALVKEARNDLRMRIRDMEDLVRDELARL